MTGREFPALDPAERNRLLADPVGPVRVLIDTDAANEIDDQFALTWALLSPDRLQVEALVAEPYSFAHLRPALRAATEALERDGTATSMVDDITSWARRLREQGLGPDDIDLVGPDEGMERSYQEILRVLDMLGRPPGDKVFRGASGYLPAAGTPVDSPGARAIIETARAFDDPLYVLAIGCLTNVASALLIEPEIARRLVVVWTSGYPTWAERSNRSSLNLVQDVAATRVVLDSGVPLVYLPGYYIGAQLRLSLPDMEAHVRGRGEIGDYLHHLYTHNPIHAQRGIDDLNARTWVIWDLITVAWVLEPGWVPTDLVPTPQLDEELRWRPRAGAPPMREAHGVDRDGIFRDFFEKLDEVSNAEHRPTDRR
jgi:inosine-uridine nucleoside N-ribohydrolase